ncbi:MAG: hypothetical protein AAFN93_14755 [Bacteroidota bacterium]
MRKGTVFIMVSILFLSALENKSLAQKEGDKYQIIKIDLKDDRLKTVIREYIDLKSEYNRQANMSEDFGIVTVQINSISKEHEVVFLSYALHQDELRYGTPSFYSVLDGNIVLITVGSRFLLSDEDIDFARFLSLVQDKVYEDLSVIYHPDTWKITIKKGRFSKKVIKGM